MKWKYPAILIAGLVWAAFWSWAAVYMMVVDRPTGFFPAAINTGWGIVLIVHACLRLSGRGSIWGPDR